MIIKEELFEKLKLAKPFHLKNALDFKYGWEDLNNLLNLRPFWTTDRLRIIAPPSFQRKWPNRDWIKNINTWPPNIMNEVISKYPCHVRDCTRISKNVNIFCSEVESRLKTSLDMHIFFSLTNKKEKGLGVHSDDHDVFVVQIEGESRVKLWNEKLDNKNLKEEPKNKPLYDIILKKNDVILLAKEHIHYLTYTGKRMSFSFLIKRNNPNPQERDWINVL
jgi:hypothetical protein